MADAGANAEWGAAWPPLGERIADALDASPVLVALLWQTPRGTGESPLEHFERVIWERLDVMIASLDQLCLQILQVASYHGVVDRPTLEHEAAGADLDPLDRRVRLLATLGLITVEHGVLRVHTDLAMALPLPLPAFERDGDLYTSDRLQNACRLLGVAGGTKKATRMAAIRSVLTDPERLLDAVRSAHPQAEQVFRRIAERGQGESDHDDGPPGAVSIWDLDLSPELVAVRGAYRAYTRNDQVAESAFDALANRCLVGAVSYGHTTWMWLDCVVALEGHLFASWAEPPQPPPAPIDEPVGVAARVVVAAEMLIDQLAADAPEGKKTGDRRPPVKVGRQAAKAVGGIEPALADIVVAAAIEQGLLMAVDVPARGRGRNREWPVQWVANRPRLEAWKALPVAQRWLLLVRAWLFGPDLGFLPHDGEHIQRFCAIGDLASLEPGTGVPTAEVAAWFAGRHIAWSPTSDDIVRDLALVGITSSGATIGLGAAGRAMLGADIAAGTTGPELDDVFGGADDSFVVQPDHTIITGALAAPDVVRMLTLIADRESDGGAVVWRLSERALARAARRVDVDTVVGFLQDHSSVAVSDNVIRFVRDHLREGATAQIAVASSYLVCDDPATVSAAVAVKPAKLTALGPTAAVSTLEPAALRAALGAKGVSAAIAGVEDRTDATDPIASYHVYQPRVDDYGLAVGPIPVGPRVVESLVGHLTADRPGRRRRP